MNFDLSRPYPPMEALSVDAAPRGKDWQYEPKWDGFRCLSFRNGRGVNLYSKSGQALTRYFPELVEALLALKPKVFALDGEIVIPHGPMFSFNDLLQRIHPAPSRVAKLSQSTPGLLIVFDLLVDGNGKVLVEQPLRERRKRLEDFARKFLDGQPSIRLSPMTTKLSVAEKWLRQAGSTLDGIIAKRTDLPYESGNRHGMQKIKTFRSADCVVGGFRYQKQKETIGSLLLGLYNDKGQLDHVGYTSALRRDQKREFARKLEKLIGPPGFTGNKPGGPSRWSTKAQSEWVPIKPKLVVEVCYDHFTDGRFRHGTKLMRFRPDKAPAQCTMDQFGRNPPVSREME